MPHSKYHLQIMFALAHPGQAARVEKRFIGSLLNLRTASQTKKTESNWHLTPDGYATIGFISATKNLLKIARPHVASDWKPEKDFDYTRFI